MVHGSHFMALVIRHEWSCSRRHRRGFDHGCQCSGKRRGRSNRHRHLGVGSEIVPADDSDEAMTDGAPSLADRAMEPDMPGFLLQRWGSLARGAEQFSRTMELWSLRSRAIFSSAGATVPEAPSNLPQRWSDRASGAGLYAPAMRLWSSKCRAFRINGPGLGALGCILASVQDPRERGGRAFSCGRPWAGSSGWLWRRRP